MNKQIAVLAKMVGIDGREGNDLGFDNKLVLFQRENNVLLPLDLVEYFKLLNRSSAGLDKDMYEFYSLNEFKSVGKELAKWGGVPDYINIINAINGSENCFVFADYMAHLFVYAIRLYPGQINQNDIYMICGDRYKIVGNSFSDFLALYFDDSMELKTI